MEEKHFAIDEFPRKPSQAITAITKNGIIKVLEIIHYFPEENAHQFISNKILRCHSTNLVQPNLYEE